MGDRMHLVDVDGRLLCPEAELRDAMDDGEFWDHVFNDRHWLHPDDSYDEDFNIPPEVAAEYELELRLANPCPECGQVGACAYDAEGRAMIHVTEDSDRG